jgi:hypothetical protein
VARLLAQFWHAREVVLEEAVYEGSLLIRQRAGLL